jgi:hypothetical protein
MSFQVQMKRDRSTPMITLMPPSLTTWYLATWARRQIQKAVEADEQMTVGALRTWLVDRQNLVDFGDTLQQTDVQFNFIERIDEIAWILGTVYFFRTTGFSIQPTDK